MVWEACQFHGIRFLGIKQGGSWLYGGDAFNAEFAIFGAGARPDSRVLRKLCPRLVCGIADFLPGRFLGQVKRA